MRNLSVDIETYSDLPLGAVGLYRYADSPAFDILLISYAIDNGDVKTIDLTDKGRQSGEALRSFLTLLREHDILMRAFNATFEWYCLSTYAQRFDYLGWTQADTESLLNRTRCTMVHGLYLGYGGSLEKMGKAVGLPADKSKMSVGKALIKLFSCPDADGKRVPPSRDPDKWRLYKEYNRNDVIAERELAKRFAPWPMPERELRLWQQDARLNATGVCVDTALVSSARAIWASEKARLTEEVVQLTGLSNPNSVGKLKEWLSAELDSEEEVSIRKDDVKDMLGDDATPDNVRRVLELRQQLGKTSVSKYDALDALTSDAECGYGIHPYDLTGGDVQVASGDERGGAQSGGHTGGLRNPPVKGCARVRGLLQFYGAHTGRWSGRGIQVQNLPKLTLTVDALDFARRVLRGSPVAYASDIIKLCFGNLPDTLSQLIRTMLVPSPGCRFAVADFSAIEARVVAWLAGEAWVNEVFATHGRIYEATAAQMFGVPLATIKKGESNYALRAKGKVATLALGYGGGASALIAMGALRMGLTEDELPDIVKRWRDANPQIRGLWYKLQRASVETVKLGAVTQVRGFVLRLEHGGGHKYLTIELPSGRKLFYVEPKIVEGNFGGEELSYKAQSAASFRYTRAWGGVLTENVVQAIARDCLAELLLRIEAAGLQVKFHVHDEVIVEAPADRSEQALDWLLNQMATPIPWAPGLKLKGDGFCSDYYRKD